MLEDIARQKSILCVEDETDHREMLALWLTLNGYEVYSASNCAGALALVGKQAFKVCIVDFRLPDGTGLELCRELQRQLPDTPLVLNTGDARPSVRAEAADLGIGVVPKPTNLDVLQEIIDNLVKVTSQ